MNSKVIYLKNYIARKNKLENACTEDHKDLDLIVKEGVYYFGCSKCGYLQQDEIKSAQDIFVMHL